MRSSSLFIFALAAALHGACGGGHAPADPIAPPSDAKSYVVWPVSNGTVTAYRFDGGTPGAAVGTAQTDKTGAFDLRLNAPATGPLLVVVSSGSYTEPATGTPVLVDGYQLSAAVPAKVRAAGDAIAGLLVSPVSHLVVQLAARNASSGAPIDGALSQAQSLLNSHFGGIDWSSVSLPPDLSDPSASSIVQLNDSAKAALVLAGLSEEAKNLSQAKNLTPGGPLNSLSLLAAIAADLNGDGIFDGYGAAGLRLIVPPTASNGYALDGQTVRATLAQGISTFLSSSRNSSHIALADAQATMNAIASDASPLLFRDQGGSVDLIPPVIQFVQPLANASVQGQVVIEASATDNVAMGTFAFTAPASLNGTSPTVENAGKTMRLKTVLDVSAMPDGPLVISVAATDSSSNTATQTLSVRVANHGPVISVSSPGTNQVVKGTVTIVASASGQNSATVASLVLVNPPLGAGPDTLPAAEALSVTWNTTKALEGPVTLHLQATDNFGGVTDAFVPVTVDNVPFGVITAHVSAGGNPIVGATVTVLAIDNASGEPVTSIGLSGQLGRCSSTDQTGAVACTLSTENYQGPIQVIAGGPGLSYTDPSDGVTVISIPQTFLFTSYIGNYKTGDAITVPLTLWTTLADSASLAMVEGKDRAQPGAQLLTNALATLDPLFAKHLTTTVTWDIRSTIPVPLTTTAQSLRDVVYAALPDVAMNQIARDRSAAASVTPGGVITAITIAQLFQQDLAADGQFDGLGQGGQQLQTAGNPAQKLDTNWLRYFLSKSLDEWLQATPNKSGLLSSDVQNAGVFDTAANDASILFGSSPSPIIYDNQPPTVTFSATFHAADGNDHLPVSYAAQRLVGGRLDLTVTASDPSGVSSLSIAQGANALTPATGSTMPTKFVGSFDTTKVADGLLTFVATASDKLGNTGTTSWQVVVDNTAPAITVTQPVASAYYSVMIPAAAVASDANAVASVVENSLNLTNLMASPNFSGSWTIPNAQTDGSVSVQYKACDIVFNCRTTPISVFVDRTPPLLTVTTAPPRYTSNSTVSMAVTADDGTGAGVSAVYAQNGSSSPVAGVQTVGTNNWTISGISLAANGDNVIAVYGVDRAIGADGVTATGNSGYSKAPPYQQTQHSLFDNTPPSIHPFALPSYYDESSLALVQTGSDPNKVSSWSYNPSDSYNPGSVGKSSVDMTNAKSVNKATTRLSWFGTTPSASDLVSANSTNTPLVAYTIDFNAATDSPIATVTYSVGVTCSGCPTFALATGNLVPDTTFSAGLRYLLPVTSDAIPALAQVTSKATVSVNISATDQAGNTGLLNGQAFQFQLVGPPVPVVDDASFFGTDPKAGGSFTLANGKYDQIFNASLNSLFGPEGTRYIRMVIYNPSPVAIAVSPSITQQGVTANGTGAYEAHETWDDLLLADAYGSTTFVYSDPNGTCPASYPSEACRTYNSFGVLTVPTDFQSGGLQCLYRCGSQGAAAFPNCVPTDNQPTARSEERSAASDLSLGTYVVGTNGAETAATSASNGGYIVPAASGTTPGRLAVYFGRPAPSYVSELRRSLTWDSSRGTYDVPWGVYMTSPLGGSCDPAGTSSIDSYTNNTWIEYLGTARAQLVGTWSLTASSVTPGTATALGASRSVVNSSSFNRSLLQ